MQKLRCFARNWCICVCLQPGLGGGSIKFAAKFVGDTCFFAFASVCNKFEGFKQLLSFLRSLCNLAWAQWLWKSKCCIQGPLELALISKVRVRVAPELWSTFGLMRLWSMIISSRSSQLHSRWDSWFLQQLAWFCCQRVLLCLSSGESFPSSFASQLRQSCCAALLVSIGVWELGQGPVGVCCAAATMLGACHETSLPNICWVARCCTRALAAQVWAHFRGSAQNLIHQSGTWSLWSTHPWWTLVCCVRWWRTCWKCKRINFVIYWIF